MTCRPGALASIGDAAAALRHPSTRDHAREGALITGITGQDGSYLAELLLDKGYEVHGLIRRASTFNTAPHRPPLPGPARPEAPAVPALRRPHRRRSAWSTLLATIEPDEVYNLARAVARARVASTSPSTPATSPASGTIRLLEAVRAGRRRLPLLPGLVARRCSAPPRRRRTRTRRSTRARPYGAAKVYAYWMTRNYREAYGMFAVNGILFNHESPRRGETFVTRKITRAVAAHQGRARRSTLYLGNLDAVRDWGYAAGVRRGHVADAAGRRARRLRARHRRPATRCATSCELCVRARRPRLGEARRASTSATCARPRSTR